MGRNAEIGMDYNSLKTSQKCFCSSSGSIASATSSSSSRSSSNGTIGKHGLRTVHLKRQCGVYLESSGKSYEKLVSNPRPGSFGFSFRGGREFGTGFFISAVENDSEAQLKGLKVGDQIIRINGLSVEDATHQEVLQLAQSHHQLTLTVKSVGLIPVKDKSEDPLTWKVVENGGVDETPLASIGSDIDRIRIEIPENSQLGCGICKGPDWRPGIFIQYTKPNSLARRCGLQPGDQILQCNRISFLQIDFSYAVSVLKNTRTLDLVLKKGSGIDLFPGESSGYSSSSSIADETVNQTASKTKRLSIVAEESDDRFHRKTCHCKHSRNATLKSSGSIDSVFDCVPGDVDCSNYRERSKSIEILTDSNFKKTVTFKNHENVTRTLLNISKPRDSCHHCHVGNQTVIKIESNDIGREVQNTPSMSVEKKIGESLISVEVHRSNENCSSENVAIEKSPSSSSFSSGSSLSSAINQEIQRRNERRLKGTQSIRQERKELAKPTNKQHTHQHDLLIAELKKKQAWEEKTSNVSTQTEADKATSTNESVAGKFRHKTSQVTTVTVNGNNSGTEGARPRAKPFDIKSLVTTFKPYHLQESQDSPPACPTPDYYSDNSLTDQSIDASQTVKNSILKFEEKNKGHVPNAVHKTVTFGQTSTKEITPIKNFIRESKNHDINHKILKNSSMSEKKSVQDLVEMQSIESYELTEPKQVAPKPPPVYFQSSSTATGSPPPPTENKKRTTVIKITEYPTEKRREPVKFDFLQQSNQKLEKAFDTELASTLSRSNLRNKMDAFANANNTPGIVRSGLDKTCPTGRYSHGINGLHATPVIPTLITENQLSNVKKTLKTFEKNTSNTVIVKIPKRN